MYIIYTTLTILYELELVSWGDDEIDLDILYNFTYSIIGGALFLTEYTFCK